MSVVVTDGTETIDTVRSVDEAGTPRTEEAFYREIVIRRAAAGQNQSHGGTAVLDEDEVFLATFRIRRASGEGAPTLVWWALEERSNGDLGLWIWNSDGSAHWDFPEGWSGEAPIATGMPWLRISR